MIDKNGRAKYLEETKNKSLVSGIKDSIVSALQTQNSSNPNEEVLKLVVKREEEQQLLDQVGKLGQALALVYKAVMRPIKLPSVFRVEGKVEVSNQLKVSNLNDLSRYFASLEQTINNISLAIRAIPPATMEAPKVVLPKDMFQSKIDLSGVTQAIQNLEESLQKVSSSDDTNRILKMVQNAVERLADKPQYIPPTVSRVQLLPMQGFTKTTDNTVGTTLTQLPAYGQLIGRRAVMIYNNSANTIYIGGSDVTTGNGMPVPASSYSPILDAGYNMPIYGIASQNGNDVRVMEVSQDTQEVGTTVQ